jgi:NAD(P)-dependent dehydrogenase (short-subunit alcohol dehydrogenase family)
MYMSVIEQITSGTIHPELNGARVLLTGLTGAAGVDIARAFADHNCRMVVQADAATPEIAGIAEVLAQSAGEMRLHTGRLGSIIAPTAFAQQAAQAFGGLEIVVNLISLDEDDLEDLAEEAEIEGFVADKLRPALEITRIAANRMRLTLREGLVLNVVRLPETASPHALVLASLIRAALAAITRREAEAWAGEAIRINAVAPVCPLSGGLSGACLQSEPEVAALALYLAGKNGRRLSGLVFDAKGAAAGSH